MKLAYDTGGEGGGLLVLLHGLGATRKVWGGLTVLTATRWIAPDLRGHGASPHAESYSLADHAADVAALIDGTNVTILGHSMGGAIALELASGRYGFTPTRVFGLGIKVAWNDDELAGMKKMAASPTRLFPTKEEALARYGRVAGLAAPDESGIVHTEQGWRLAYDPATATVGPPSMGPLMALSRCPVRLARGERDHMVSLDQLRAYDPQARDLPGGHNAMVENRGAVRDWIGA